ncbi:alternative ribosome rescue aminoacyl-tRNA hydrolase ArfB [Olivibacter domesticus]|uniref:Ribosome-associated protein n=1 Tax=Olivibacter domesticus TaxID=407022 RepID=A0A1H7PHC4_OLID1|nr:alternative ribosome rescue aminoacyl-tRNA hydrolase ArfB [Olivibacter domesticus]SEL35180.1 ribosome-associated protein [Olivibacter domesticus]
MIFESKSLEPFISYKTSRSGGKGGQHVNKVSTKVELLFDLNACSLFTDEQKLRIKVKLNQRIQSEGKLQVICQQDRSQLKNKEIAKKKLITLINHALKLPQQRKESKRSKASVEKRLDSKRQKSLLKISRKKQDEY